MAAAKQCSAGCGEMTSNQNGRCTECGNLACRISRHFKGSPENKAEFTKSLETMKDRGAFQQMAKGLYSDDLAIAISQVVERKLVAESEVSLVGNGCFLDMMDLEKKYKDKPERLNGIKANARRFKDPISNVELIEDMEYRSTHSNSVKQSLQMTNTATQESSIKKRKTETKPKENKASPVKVEPAFLAQASRDKLQKIVENNTKLRCKLQSTIDKAEAANDGELLTHMPPRIVAGSKASIISSQQLDDKCNMILGAALASPQDLKSINEESSKIQGDLKERDRALKLQVAEAIKASA